jgi:hypothetical protein
LDALYKGKQLFINMIISYDLQISENLLKESDEVNEDIFACVLNVNLILQKFLSFWLLLFSYIGIAMSKWICILTSIILRSHMFQINPLTTDVSCFSCMLTILILFFLHVNYFDHNISLINITPTISLIYIATITVNSISLSCKRESVIFPLHLRVLGNSGKPVTLKTSSLTKFLRYVFQGQSICDFQ